MKGIKGMASEKEYKESAERIINIRKSTGLNQKSFCGHFNIPFRTWQDWEHGVRRPPEYIPQMLEKLVKYEGLELSE